MAKTKVSKLLRVGLPILIIVTWLVTSAIGGPYFGKIEEVSSNDLATFLPESAESTKVNDKIDKFVDSSSIPAIVVFESNSALTEKEQDEIDSVRAELSKDSAVVDTISPAVLSEDEKAAFLVVPLDSDSEFRETVPSLQKTVADTKPSLNYKFTGPAMFAKDLNKAFAGIDGTLLVVALSVVFVILLVVYRSPILPVVTLIGAIIALSSAILLVWYLAKYGIVQLNGQVQGILFILVIGAATDYSLLYIARYREELTRHKTAWGATVASWKASLEPIVAAGSTVSLGLLCLLASDLGSNKSLGPIGGIGVIFAILIALTFLPAVLLLFGRVAFWPRKPKFENRKSKENYQSQHPVWSKVGKLVGKHPRRLWVGTMALLLLACVAVPQFKAEGVSQDNLIMGKSEAREGQEILDNHFPGGAGSPAYIVAKTDLQDKIVDAIESNEGVDGVSVFTTDKEKSRMPVGSDAREIREEIRQEVEKKRSENIAELRSSIKSKMVGAPDFVVDQVYEEALANIPSVDELTKKADPFKDIEPKTINGTVLISATLTNSASSVGARQTISQLRDELKKVDSSIMIGGVSAVQLDTNTAANHDLKIVIPLILLAITVVLMILLRSIVAPFVLLFTTVVSFGATLGIAALLFNHVWNFPGADPAVIIFGFVFLVALGIDYNIFLMTRVHEETKKLGVRDGTLKALVVTGGVITSAGVVLAATFAALYVIPILFLAQIAFIVAFGVLLDTLIVRSILVPALTLEIGKPMWWPSKLSRKKGK